uniref:Uncharacterized protein n=1 Tax=Daphnia galeata TaxID=27404 RepID=A0A8J2RUS3_9CRUS|nr:unnamed protein product [Daphnia galeata]
MLAKFVLTRPSRREFIEKGNNAATTILNRYPRLKDMKEAIEDEFKFLKNSTPVAFVESWKSVEKKVVARGKETLTRSPEAKAILEKLEKAEENYDSVAFTSLAFELLLHLLPNKTAKGKRTRTPTTESWPALFQNFDTVIDFRIREKDVDLQIWIVQC